MTQYSEPRSPGEPEDSARRAKKFAGRRPHRVLVVDDDSLIRWAVAESLRTAGYDVVEAADAASALRALRSRIDAELVFLDLRLPDTDDLRLLAAIRQLWPHLPVILMTAHGDDELQGDALRLGAFTVLNKPFEMSDVGFLARSALAGC